MSALPNDLVRRMFQHRDGTASKFTKKYRVQRLVYFEVHGDINHAIKREKNMKKWNRAWKIELISKFNPDWHDLLPGLVEPDPIV